MRKLLLIMLLIVLASCTASYLELPKEGNQGFILGEPPSDAVILIHGLGATPWEVRELATFLHARNYAVYVPLLPGHGTTVDDLRRSTWENWHGAVQQTYDQARRSHDQVYVVGVSAGANLALLLAAEEELDGVVVIGPALFYQDPRVKYALVLKYFFSDTPRDLSAEEQPHYSPVFPSRSVGELVLLSRETRKILPEVTEPILVLQSLTDPKIDPRSSVYVHDHVSSAQKELLLREYAEHVVIRGAGSEEAMEEIAAFIST